MAFMSAAQAAALSALGGVPPLVVEPVLRGWWLVTRPDGEAWVIDEAGVTHRHNDEVSEVAA